MHPGLLVLGGFLLGTAGVKAVTSRPAHKACVQVTACALQAKDCVSRVVDEAKAECDDIMAEANYVKVTRQAERESEEVVADCSCAKEVKAEEPAKAATEQA